MIPLTGIKVVEIHYIKEVVPSNRYYIGGVLYSEAAKFS
jgi:hypothetical protein